VQGQAKTRALVLLLGAGALFLLFFFLLPIAVVIVQSFQNEAGGFSLGAYTTLLGDSQFHGVYLRTLRVALIVTPIAVVVSYPTAYLMMKVGPVAKGVLTSLVILPLMTSSVARTYAWIVILGRYGIVSQALMALHITREPARILYSESAIVIGLLQLFLPLMVLNLVSAMENVPFDLEEAAQSLGSNKIGSFFRVIVPLSFDGLVMGATLVFTGCFTAYVTPAVLGGSKVLTLSTLMRQQALGLMDWNSATVLALIMILTTLVLHVFMSTFRPKNAQ
jgi:putative spermidine/putrescine transport system permease protein